MSPTPVTPDPTPAPAPTSLPLAIIGAVLNGVLAVEKNAPTLAGNTKAQLVLDSVAAGAALAPVVINLISQIVATFNAVGIFKKKAK